MDIRAKGEPPSNEKMGPEEAEGDAAEGAGRLKGVVGDAADKLSPEVKNLIEEGKKRGFVTYDELNKVLPDDMVSPDKLDTILQMMDDLGIEMVETAAEGGEAKEGAGFEPDDDEREFEQPKRSRPRPAASRPRRSTTRSACISPRWARSRCFPARTSCGWPSGSRSRASGSAPRCWSRRSPSSRRSRSWKTSRTESSPSTAP